MTDHPTITELQQLILEAAERHHAAPVGSAAERMAQRQIDGLRRHGRDARVLIDEYYCGGIAAARHW